MALQLVGAGAARAATPVTGISPGPSTDVGTPTLTDSHNPANNIVKSDNMTWLSNTKGVAANHAGANFIHSSASGGQTATNTSAAYWHNGYIYVADSSRGVDVFRHTGGIKGVIQPKVCWNVCDKE